MTISEMLLPEFDQEMANTRKMLERVPVDRPDWKPHPKSMPLGRLAGHMAELPSWTTRIVNTEGIDLGEMMSGGYQPYIPSSLDDLLQKFDQFVREARQALAGAGDEHLNRNWSLQMNGQTLASGSRLMMLRSMSLNHLIHHRAQMSVYLRLNDIPIPGLYGPSADER